LQGKKKNHQPRLRVVAWVVLNQRLLRQAMFPAFAMELLIRMAKLDRTPVWFGVAGAL